MKKIFFAAAAMATCMFVSCKDEKSAGAADEAATYKQKNSDFMKSIESGDFSKTQDWLADDAIDHAAAADMVSDIKGRDSIIANLKKMNQWFQPGYKMNITAQAYDGGYLFVMGNMEGTTTANPGMGMPPNTKMDMHSVDVIKIKGGKASEHWAFASPAEMMKMMGGGPGAMPPAADKMMTPPAGDKTMPDTMKK